MAYQGKQARNIWFSLTLLNALVGATFYLNAYQYWFLVKQDLYHTYAFCLLWFASNYLLLATVTKEPGIIPKQEDTDFPDSEFEKYKNDQINYQNGVFKPVRMSQNFLFTQRAKVFYMSYDKRHTIFKPLRYCDLCNIFRPPTRCSHCYHCDACIIGFDHHCLWLGTCIGLRNYFEFILFLVVTSFFILLNIYWLLQELIDVSLQSSFKEAVIDRIHVTVILPVVLLLICLIGLLLGFHLMLLFKNETTHEFFKDLYNMEQAPSKKQKLRRMQATINPFVVTYGCLDRLRGMCLRLQKSRRQKSLLSIP